MPSAALKFFVDDTEGANRPSMNLVTQVSFDGITDPYFFAEDFTNHPQRSTNECMMETMVAKIAEASKFPFSTGTAHFAGYEEDGTFIGKDLTEFPFEVILKPNRIAFPRSTDTEENFLDFFENWSMMWPDTQELPVLFEVHARRDPDSDTEYLGEIKLTSELFASEYGDEKLFFKHERYERDLGTLKKARGKSTVNKWINHMRGEGREVLKKWEDQMSANPNINLDFPSNEGDA